MERRDKLGFFKTKDKLRFFRTENMSGSFKTARIGKLGSLSNNKNKVGISFGKERYVMISLREKG